MKPHFRVNCTNRDESAAIRNNWIAPSKSRSSEAIDAYTSTLQWEAGEPRCRDEGRARRSRENQEAVTRERHCDGFSFHWEFGELFSLLHASVVTERERDDDDISRGVIGVKIILESDVGK